MSIPIVYPANSIEVSNKFLYPECPHWLSFLDETSSFAYEENGIRFTCRKESRKDSSMPYWIAYKKINKKLKKKYLGGASNVTRAVLSEVSSYFKELLNSPVVTQAVTQAVTQELPKTQVIENPVTEESQDVKKLVDEYISERRLKRGSRNYRVLSNFKAWLEDYSSDSSL